MKKIKAKELENVTEGVISVDELMQLQDGKRPQINLMLKSATDANKYSSILIVRYRSTYRVWNNICATIPGAVLATPTKTKPYKYLTCAVKRAVKDYKAAIRTNQWRIMIKAV